MLFFFQEKLVDFFEILANRRRLSKNVLLSFFEMAQKIIKVNNEKAIFPKVIFQNRIEELLTQPFVYSKINLFFVFQLFQKFPNEFKLLNKKLVFKKLIKF